MHDHVWVMCCGRRVLTFQVIGDCMFECGCQFRVKSMVLGANCHYNNIGIDCMFCGMFLGMV